MLRQTKLLRIQAFLAFTLVLLAARVNAQLQFTLTDSAPVGLRPVLATIGRFEPDGASGVAVVSFRVAEVAVFPTSIGGVLDEATAFALGGDMRGLVSFDIDGNGLDDLVVADKKGGMRLLLARRLPGGFLPPEEIALDTASVELLRTGNFDGVPPLDMATANGRFGSVSLVYGTMDGFITRPNIFLAGSVTDVAALDLDDDGLDDLTVLTERDSGISAVTSLRSDSLAFTLLGPAVELDVIGVRLITGRFDEDQSVDLVLPAEGPDVREYSVRTLFNQHPPTGSGEPRFAVQSDSFACPLDSRGRVSRCTIGDAVAGDFDQDGIDDLALSMPVPGVVVLLRRHTAGFDTPFVLDIDGKPEGLAAGDLNGDGATDLVITEFDDSVVTIATNGPLAGCTGDCNGDGMVTVDEIIVAIQIALGESSIDTCRAADTTGDSSVTVDEIVATVETALGGC